MALNSSLKTVTLALPLAGAALAADEAEACSPDPCYFVDLITTLEPINAASIPTDGALLLQWGGSPPQPDWHTQVMLEVTRDGQPIAGAVVESLADGVLMWRPDVPFEPSAVYKVVGSFDNVEWDQYYEFCGDDIITLDFEFMTDAGPSAPLTTPTASAEETVLTAEFHELLDLVCCDEAMPYDGYGGCGDYYVTWNTGFCASRHGFGTLRVDLTVEDGGLPAPTKSMVSRQVFIDGTPASANFDGTLVASASQPFCTTVELHNLATGEKVMSEETCHGAAVADQLGDQQLDPTPELQAQCKGGAYTCELDPSMQAWDENLCTPWPGGGSTTGETTDGPTTDDPTTDGPTTEGPTTDDPTSGGPGTDSGGPGSDGSDGTSGTAGTDSASGAQDGLVDHGCACDSRGTSPLGWLGMLVGLGLLRPRRRGRPPGT